MRLGLIVLFVALLLAAVAGQNSLLQPTEAEDTTSAITACAVQGESCPQPPLDSSPGSVVLEHQVFVGGCGAFAPPPPAVFLNHKRQISPFGRDSLRFLSCPP